MGLLTMLRTVERATRPADPEFVEALQRRWAELPDVAKTPGQVLGRHGVGGEVSLLPPGDHAAALAIMREHGREPMSFTHGDVDEDYLVALALESNGERRFDRLSFAAHFDKFMYGRRGIERPPDEKALNPYRRRFADMFARLRRDHGVRHFLAHNMTVTPGNQRRPAAARDPGTAGRLSLRHGSSGRRHTGASMRATRGARSGGERAAAPAAATRADQVGRRSS